MSVPVEICEARVLLSGSNQTGDADGQDDFDYDTDYFADATIENAPSFSEFGDYDYFAAAADSPMSDDFTGYEDDYDAYFQSAQDAGGQSWDSYASQNYGDVTQDGTGNSYSGDSVNGNSLVSGHSQDSLDSFFANDSVGGNGTATGGSPLRVPSAFQLNVASLPLHALRDDLFSVQPDGTTSFSTVATMESTADDDFPVTNASGDNTSSAPEGTAGVPASLTNSNMLRLDQTWNSPADWSVTQSVTNSWNPSASNSSTGTQSDTAGSNSLEPQESSGTESFSITVINGTTTITTYSLSTSYSSSSGNVQNSGDGNDPYAVPQGWIDGALASATTSGDRNGGTADGAAANANSGTNNSVGDTQTSSGDSAATEPVSGNSFTSSSSLTITTTETLVTMDDGTPGIQTISSLTWSASFSWFAGDSIDLANPPASDADPAPAANAPLAGLTVGGTFTYTVFASGSIAGSFSVSNTRPQNASLLDTVLGTNTSVSFSFAVSAMAGGSYASKTTASLNDFSGSTTDQTDEHLTVDFTDESSANGYIGFSFAVGNAPEPSSAATGDVAQYGGSSDDTGTATNSNIGGGPGLDSRPPAGQTSAGDAVSGGVSGLSLGFNVSVSTSSSRNHQYSKLTRLPDPQPNAYGYSEETLSDVQNSKSNGYLSLGIDGTAPYFELGFGGSGNTDISENRINFSTGAYMYEDDYMTIRDKESYTEVSNYAHKFGIGVGAVETSGITRESTSSITQKKEVESHLDLDGWFGTETHTWIYRNSSGDDPENGAGSSSQPTADGATSGDNSDDTGPIYRYTIRYADNQGVRIETPEEWVPGSADDPGHTIFDPRSAEDILAEYLDRKTQLERLQAELAETTDPAMRDYLQDQIDIQQDILGTLAEEAAAAGITAEQLAGIDAQAAGAAAANPIDFQPWDGGDSIILAGLGGAGTGFGHGFWMIVNAGTFHQIDSLDSYVDEIVAANGGWYSIANVSAHIGAYSAYAAGTLIGLHLLGSAGGGTAAIGPSATVHPLTGQAGWQTLRGYYQSMGVRWSPAINTMWMEKMMQANTVFRVFPGGWYYTQWEIGMLQSAGYTRVFSWWLPPIL